MKSAGLGVDGVSASVMRNRLLADQLLRAWIEDRVTRRNGKWLEIGKGLPATLAAIAATGLLPKDLTADDYLNGNQGRMPSNQVIKLFSIDTCQCCGGTAIKQYIALLSPFILDYVLGGAGSPPTRLNECGRCGHRFYRNRFTDAEMAILYQGYRGEHYFEARNKGHLEKC
jgi:hypothetical protein